MKIRAEINEMETKKKNIQRINETKSWFSEKINKIDKPLTNMTKQPREKMKKEDITTNTNEIQRTIREYFQNVYSKQNR
jgi:hypothetical protein